MKFDFFSIIKRSAKAWAQQHQKPLHEAQEHLAKTSGFANFHELTAVANTNADDARLLKAAMGISRLEDAIYENEVMAELELLVEDMMSGATAETNAYLFGIEDAGVTSSTYNPLNGVLTLGLSFSYAGEQDPDRVYHGTTFYVTASLDLFRKDGAWLLSAGDALTILTSESDQDRRSQKELASRS